MRTRSSSSWMALLSFTAVCAAIFATGCSGEATSSAGSTQGAGSTGGAQSGSSSGDSSGVMPGPIVFNEVSATGTDWIELANESTAEVDLEAFGLCDSNVTGQCDLTRALRFPSGTKLSPTGYLLIVGNQPADAGAGPQTMCLMNGPSSCFYVTWKVSSSNGESIFLISPKDEVVGELKYPQNAAPIGQTWGRLPDRTGDLKPTAPTPGAPNAAP